jgi:hypothetical protein
VNGHMAAFARATAEARRWFGERTGVRPSAQLSSSLLATLAASAAAVLALVETNGGGIFCSVTTRVAGANIQRAIDVVLFGGVIGALVAVAIRNRPRLRVLNLLLVAGVLTAALVLVARDSAISKEITTCSFMETTTSRETHDLSYLYAVWGAALITILVQAARDWRAVGDWRPGLVVLVIAPAAIVVGLLEGFHGSSASGGSQNGRKTNQERLAGGPGGVFVCRDPIPGPEALGGYQCAKDVDIGTAPISPPNSLMCVSDLAGVKDKRVGIEILYGRTPIRRWTERSTDSETEVYAVFDSSYVGGLPGDAKLPIGFYRCRILVDRKVARSRVIRVGRLRPVNAPLRYHYFMRIQTLKGRRHGTATHLGDDFMVVISSPDLPRSSMARVELCVNGPAASCPSSYLAGGVPTRVEWEVDRGEGAGALYRLSLRVQGHEITHRDLRLVRAHR